MINHLKTFHQINRLSQQAGQDLLRSTPQKQIKCRSSNPKTSKVDRQICEPLCWLSMQTQQEGLLKAIQLATVQLKSP